MVIRLARTTDILGTIAGKKKEGQFICGFSMETENLLENSRKKLEKKKLESGYGEQQRIEVVFEAGEEEWNE